MSAEYTVFSCNKIYLSSWIIINFNNIKWNACMKINGFMCVFHKWVCLYLYTALRSVLYEALTITLVTFANTDKKSLRLIGCTLSATRKFSGRRAMRLVLGDEGYSGWPNRLSIILIPPPWQRNLETHFLVIVAVHFLINNSEKWTFTNT